MSSYEQTDKLIKATQVIGFALKGIGLALWFIAGCVIASHWMR